MAAVRPPPVRVQVVRAGASLEQVVGQDDRPDEPIIVARQQPVGRTVCDDFASPALIYFKHKQ